MNEKDETRIMELVEKQSWRIYQISGNLISMIWFVLIFSILTNVAIAIWAMAK